MNFKSIYICLFWIELVIRPVQGPETYHGMPFVQLSSYLIVHEMFPYTQKRWGGRSNWYHVFSSEGKAV